MMSANKVTLQFFFTIIIFISIFHSGTPLECYVCTSVKNSACSSSLSGITQSTCFSAEDSSTSETSTIVTSASTESTSSHTAITDSSISSSTTLEDFSFSTTSETENQPSTNLETTTSSVTQTGTETTILVSMTSELTNYTEEITLSTPYESSSLATISSSDDSESQLRGEENSEVSEVRVLRDTEEDFACYTLTVIIAGETVTDRGCVAKSSSMCENLNELKYPDYNLSTCATCNVDGCNSSTNNLSDIFSILLALIIFFLTR